jgi:hypothetical protein
LRCQLSRRWKAVRENDIHRFKQQQIGQFTATVHESGEYRFSDAKTVG